MYLGVYKDVTSLVSDSAYNLKTYPDPGFFLTLPEMLSNFFDEVFEREKKPLEIGFRVQMAIVYEPNRDPDPKLDFRTGGM